MENNTAWITSCKSQDSGWQVNGTMSVPNDPANTDCQDVLAWIEEGNTPDPQFTSDEIAANAQQVINGESLAYLASTDWYVTRQSETDVAVPQDISTLRAEARAAVVTGA
tara:strand:+ start:1040 stop:1369 length:330 start_codon:yes stop_codon:yes gene_type:complete